MKLHCLDLVAFADGELEPKRAEAFRAHLPSCPACRASLLQALQLSTGLAALTPAATHMKLAPDAPADSSPVATIAPDPPLPSSASSRRRISPWAGMALAAAAVVALVARPGDAPAPADAFAGLATRPYEVRFAYGNAAQYRRARDEIRGTGESSGATISYAALDALQKRGDDHGLAIAQAWRGANLAEVAAQLHALPPIPSIASDHAAIKLLTTSSDNLESVLAELEAVQGSEDRAAARAARWNYAIALEHLGLSLSAARSFRMIADEREAGWADEARRRADADEVLARDARTAWTNAYEHGKALIDAGTVVPIEVVRRFPGVMRAQLYNAVRTAPTPERVLALTEIAAELDRLGGSSILVDYVQRVAGFDFRRRAQLADAYARLLHGESPTAALSAELKTPSPGPEVADIVMGALVQLDVVTDHLETYRRLTKQTGDPWFELRLAQAEATAEIQSSNWLGAEVRLVKAQALCGSAVLGYQCLALARQLGKLYTDLHRVPEALAIVYAAVNSARSSREWGKYRQLLWSLADIERFNASTAMARAYAGEVLAITSVSSTPCDDNASFAYRTLAGAALLDVDGRAARRHLEAALRCGPPDLRTANYLADVARLDPQPGDLALLKRWLATLRVAPTLGAAERVLADEIEGRLLVEYDRAAGAALLERAIGAADALPHDVDAAKARAGAYSVLVFDAAHRGDHARVMNLIARELALPPPGVCTVGMVAEDERAVVVVRGADGLDRALYDRARGPRASTPTIPAELAFTLDGCDHVQVMAQAALQGQPRVLPARLAWSYATGARHEPAPFGQEPGVTTLMVTNVIPPVALHLAPLLPRPPDAARSTETLTGPAATPAHVLAAMRDASEIQFHTHALVNLGVSDASHLVLSPEPGGRYALTAEAIRGSELRGRPLVVLAACDSARGARYQHAPWSLPHAFLAAGARGVLAAATEIPDREAGPLFTRVLDRIRAGAHPAAALREERMAALASNPSSWVADVILFE